jgi:hypothetical protein
VQRAKRCNELKDFNAGARRVVTESAEGDSVTVAEIYAGFQKAQC